METRESTGEVAGAKGELKSIVSEAKQEASRIAESAREKVSGSAEDKIEAAADKVGTVAGILRDAGERLTHEQAGFGRYAESAAGQVDRLAQYLRSHDVNEMFRDAETFARRHPELFLGGAFLAGMVATRFLKSSPRRESAAPLPSYESGYGYEGGFPREGRIGQPATGFNQPSGYTQPTAGYTPPAGGFGYAAPVGTVDATRTRYSEETTEPFNPPHPGGPGPTPGSGSGSGSGGGGF
jgi:hypothetical protein